MTPTAHQARTDFLSARGEMGNRIRSFDWSSTSVGPVESWPASLKTAVRICVSSRHPMVLWWGKTELTQFYNDAYISFLGKTKHPKFLGCSARDCWSEIWPIMGPMLDGVFATGEATWSEDFLYVLNRHLPREEGYFTFSYSPIWDDYGTVAGIFCSCYETTGRVIGERRLRTLRNLAGFAMQAKTGEEACELAARTLAENRGDVPFALIYFLDDLSQARLVALAGLEPGSVAAPITIDLTQTARDAVWPLRRVLESDAAQMVADLTTRFGPLPGGVWPEPAEAALMLPIAAQGQARPAGFLIAGISPRRIIDPDYRGFFDLIAGHVSTAVANARANEEERRRAAALAELDRAKTRFFSNVSHEFRTPLTLMLGPLESLLAKKNTLPAGDRTQVETAHRNSLRLLKLVNSLLDFSRIEAGRMTAFYEPVDLARFTADLASGFRSTMEAGGLQFIVDCQPLSQPVYLDREMWEKIVLNLLSNAFKFTLEGAVHIRVNEQEGKAVLTVTDTGVGIGGTELPHIFERFHRVEGARGRTYEGSGIGLALIQELVKLHGGAVEARSRAGEGSTFIVTLLLGNAHLPKDRVSATTSAPGSTNLRVQTYTGEAMMWVANGPVATRTAEVPALAGSNPTGKPLPRVLVVDDNADMRAHVASILGVEYLVIAVSDGAAALKAAREDVPELVLADVMMPVLDGFGLLRELRNDHRLHDIPVILISARAGEEARIEGIAAGADDYITKPFSARELAARVRTHVDLARRRKEVEGALRESEAQFRNLAEAIPALCWMAHADGNVFWYNSRWYEYTGTTFQQMQGSGWQSVHNPEVLPAVMERWTNSIRTHEPFEMVFPLRRADGVFRPFLTRIVPVTDDSGSVVRWFGTGTDITNQKEIESELRNANADLEQFAYSAGHDLREPLRTIRLFGELLAQSARERLDGPSLEFLGTIVSAAARMETLVRDLRAYTHTMRFEIPVEAASGQAALEGALANLREAIEESAAVIDADSLPTVRVHGLHLQQVFQNLVGNAVKYHRPGVAPAVRITAKAQNESWLFSVSDNGIGIEPQYREWIFGLFKRLHTRDQYSGTGVGLAICRRIVERYGGKVWVESVLGKGTTFYFTIPA